MRSHSARWPLGAIASIALLCACGSSDESSTQAPAVPSPGTNEPVTTELTVPEPSAPGRAVAEVAVPELLNFTASLVGGGEYSGAKAAGRTTAFWFWAPT